MNKTTEYPERIWYHSDGAYLSYQPAEHEGWQEFVRSDLCASGQQVQALEWESSETNYTQADCVLGQYQIRFLSEFEWWQLSAPYKPGSDWKDGFTKHESKSAAKAAAQADYEQRIRTTLTPAPQPEGQDALKISPEYQALFDEVKQRAQPEAATPTAQEAVPVVSPEALIDLIGELGSEVYYLLDDCETSGPVGEEIHTITGEGLAKVSAILDRIDALPFEEPGVILGTGAMLQAALRQTFAHPPQLSETVAEAQIDAIALALWKRIYKQTEGEWHPNIRQADELARAALRALKGGKDNE